MIEYQVKDVLRNKHTGGIVRLLPEVHSNGCVGIFQVYPSGYVNMGGCSPEHWEKISTLEWYWICIPFILKQFGYRYQYHCDKQLGMVNPMSASDYWQTHNHYKEVWKAAILYGYIDVDLKVKVVDLPAWREVHFNAEFERPILQWLVRRLKHLIW
jgi:hypothetical protein